MSGHSEEKNTEAQESIPITCNVFFVEMMPSCN